MYKDDLNKRLFNTFCDKYDKFYKNTERKVHSIWHCYKFNSVGERLEKLHENYGQLFIKFNKKGRLSTLFQIDNIEIFFKYFTDVSLLFKW